MRVKLDYIYIKSSKAVLHKSGCVEWLLIRCRSTSQLNKTLSNSLKVKVEFLVHYVALINRPDLNFCPQKSFLILCSHLKAGWNIGQIDFVQTANTGDVRSTLRSSGFFVRLFIFLLLVLQAQMGRIVFLCIQA